MIRQPAGRGLVPSTIHRCGLSLGSNVGDRLRHLQLAAQAVGLLADYSHPVFKSAVYETEPVGCAPGTDRFLNAVMEIGFLGEPEQLLDRLRAIESALGRPADREKNAPRTIDLDLLYADALVVRTDTLELPHPRLSQRRFVLQPLAEIRPSLILPGDPRAVRDRLSDLPEGEPPLHIITREW